MSSGNSTPPVKIIFPPGASQQPLSQHTVRALAGTDHLLHWSMASSTTAPRELLSPTRRGDFQRVTLEAETNTPRARTVTASYLRAMTPEDEGRPARRQRMKNIGKARARAIIRLDPIKHEAYREAEAARKQWALCLKPSWDRDDGYTPPVRVGDENRAAQHRADFKRWKEADMPLTKRHSGTDIMGLYLWKPDWVPGSSGRWHTAHERMLPECL